MYLTIQENHKIKQTLIKHVEKSNNQIKFLNTNELLQNGRNLLPYWKRALKPAETTHF